MIPIDDNQKPIYVSVLSEELFRLYEKQFNCDTTAETEACKAAFVQHLRDKPGDCVLLFLGWRSDLVSGFRYWDFYRSWSSFLLQDSDKDWLLLEFVNDVARTFAKTNKDALVSLLENYKGRYVVPMHPDQALS